MTEPQGYAIVKTKPGPDFEDPGFLKSVDTQGEAQALVGGMELDGWTGLKIIPFASFDELQRLEEAMAWLGCDDVEWQGWGGVF